MPKKFEIRNSTAEFLIFQIEGKEDGVQVMYHNESVWCTQKVMAQLFDCSSDNIGLHLKNIYETGELAQEATTENFSVVQNEGERQVNRKLKFYNLDAIISVGYRVNSTRATQFRQWCTFILRQFAIRGYVIDKKRMENGAFLNIDYFEHLLAEIREIRLSERRFYQKLTDIYATSIDYNRDAPTTRQFFKKVQNKMHYAVHGRTAAELIIDRANAEKEHMGLTTWENAPNGKIVKPDVSIAKNYLKKSELEDMGRIVNSFLDLAEDMAKTRSLIEEIRPGQSIGIFIGPEGGFAPEEIEQAMAHATQPITLGKRILRTETAGMTVLSILMYTLEGQELKA